MKVYVASLGCPKNFVDTELYLHSLKEALGGRIELTSSLESAGLIFINTCAFIEPAVSESIETILELAEARSTDQLLAAAGCLVWRYGRELEALLPEVDLFLYQRDPGTIGLKLAEALSSRGASGLQLVGDAGPGAFPGRFQASSPWQRYVKIAEGCSNRCTYCLIPKIRGPLRCRPPSEIVSEIQALEAEGAKEITIVAQDVTAYEWGDTDISALLRKVLSETSVPWIRLLYLYPERLSKGLLELMASEPRICPYLDMPIQHVSRRVLRRMGRPYDLEFISKQVGYIRQLMPDAAIRTTVITGFPGETEEDFTLLKEALSELRFDHLGCFPYWDEEGCAASRLPDKVSRQRAEARRQEIMALQAAVSADRNSRFLGRRLEVLVDGYCQETDLLLCGRSRYQAPDIDGRILINQGTARPGGICEVEITEAHTYDLVGRVIAGQLP